MFRQWEFDRILNEIDTAVQFEFDGKLYIMNMEKNFAVVSKCFSENRNFIEQCCTQIIQNPRQPAVDSLDWAFLFRCRYPKRFTAYILVNYTASDLKLAMILLIVQSNTFKIHTAVGRGVLPLRILQPTSRNSTKF